MDEQYFTVKQVAEMLHFRVETIRLEIHDKRLRAIKIRGDYRISLSDLNAYLDRMATTSTEQENEEEGEVELLLAG